jgi:DNA-binding CsgD family transcriptional regulator
MNMTLDAVVSERIRAFLQNSVSTSYEPPQTAATPYSRRNGARRFSAGNGNAETGAQELARAGFEILDLLNIGAIVCGVSAKVLFANRTAEAILRSGDGLAIKSDGTIHALQEHDAVVRLIEKACHSTNHGQNGDHESAMSVRRSSRRPLTLVVRPVGRAAPIGEQSRVTAALIMVMDSELPVQTKESELRRLYGLTVCESRLAKLLMEGRDLDACCQELGISRSTVRMHRRNLFSKTGVSRQTQLIALLFRSIGLGPRTK